MRRVITGLALLALFASGCISLQNDDNRYANPLGTTLYEAPEVRGAAELVVLDRQPKNRYAGPPVAFNVIFNEAVKADLVEKYVYLGDARNTVVPCKFFFYDLLETSSVLLEMVPLESLHSGETYYFTIGPELQSRLGEKLVNPGRTSFVFSNVPLPRD